MPQMLNYESVGGVNFKKGCYPGQEVVARSQYRGTPKRRAFIVHAQRACAGQEVFQAADRSSRPAWWPRPRRPGGRLGSHRLAAAERGRGGRAARRQRGWPALKLLPLPYLLLADV